MQQTLSYTKLTQFQTAQTDSKLTNQQRFWKKYQNNNFFVDSSRAVQSVSCNNNDKNLMLIGQGRSIKIVDTTKKQPETLRQINSFYENVSALCMRKDGNVLAAADQSGKIEVIDAKQRFHLRKFHNHKKRVNALEYIDNDLYSAGDDFVIRHYDVASGQVVHSYDNAHTDYIKSVKALQNNHILSGGYDGIVNLYDFRVHEKAQMFFKHEEQIESMDLYPSALSFIVGGGNKVSIWDIRSGKSLMAAKNNKKTVTSVKLFSQGTRYITTSLDHYIKVFKSDTFELTYQEKLDAGILSFDCTQNGQCLGLGVDGGRVIFKLRKQRAEGDTDDESEQEIQDEIALWMKKNEQRKFAYNDKYFYRGIYEEAKTYDLKFSRFQAKKSGTFDKYLRKFQYKRQSILYFRAFVECAQKKNMTLFLSLVDQLIQRGVLIRALRSLSAEQTSFTLAFLKPLVFNQKYAAISNFVLFQLISNLSLNLELHEKQINSLQGESLVYELDRQIEVIQELAKTQGMLAMVENLF